MRRRFLDRFLEAFKRLKPLINTNSMTGGGRGRRRRKKRKRSAKIFQRLEFRWKMQMISFQLLNRFVVGFGCSTTPETSSFKRTIQTATCEQFYEMFKASACVMFRKGTWDF